MRLLYNPFLIVLFVVAFASCKKDKKDPPPDNTPNFAPMTAGSTWTYQVEGANTYTLTATDRDTVALGRTYKVITNNNGPNNYWAKSANEYYRFGTLPTIGSFSELYLKDNQDVNNTWNLMQTFNFPGVPIPLVATLKYTVKGKDLTRTVNNKVYTGVTHIRMDVSVSSGVGDAGGGDFYYANKVGMIQNTVNITAMGSTLVNRSESLTAYTIK